MAKQPRYCNTCGNEMAGNTCPHCEARKSLEQSGLLGTCAVCGKSVGKSEFLCSSCQKELDNARN